jgi:hypothetical protein
VNTVVVQHADLHLGDEWHIVQSNQTRDCPYLMPYVPQRLLESMFLRLTEDDAF